MSTSMDTTHCSAVSKVQRYMYDIPKDPRTGSVVVYMKYSPPSILVVAPTPRCGRWEVSMVGVMGFPSTMNLGTAPTPGVGATTIILGGDYFM